LVIFVEDFAVLHGTIFKIPSWGSLFSLLLHFHDMKKKKESSGL